jgi:hypothetical protein
MMIKLHASAKGKTVACAFINGNAFHAEDSLAAAAVG